MKVLVINAGSSSIKYQLYRMPEGEVLAKGVIERIGEERSLLSHTYDGRTHQRQMHVADHEEGMELLLDTLVSKEVGVIETISEIGAVGHRVVHGGEEFTGSVIVNDAVVGSIEKFADLAPLHNPPNLAGIQAAQRNLPGIPHHDSQSGLFVRAAVRSVQTLSHPSLRISRHIASVRRPTGGRSDGTGQV